MGIHNGSKVSIHYTLKVDGQIVDTSRGKEPFTYVQGEGQMIPGLERNLEGLGAGDQKFIAVEPQEGYGERNSEAVQTVPRSAFKDAELHVGDIVQGQAGGEDFQACIIELAGDEVKLDLNHPLAGKTLNFDVEVVSVEG